MEKLFRLVGELVAEAIVVALVTRMGGKLPRYRGPSWEE